MWRIELLESVDSGRQHEPRRFSNDPCRPSSLRGFPSEVASVLATMTSLRANRNFLAVDCTFTTMLTGMPAEGSGHISHHTFRGRIRVSEFWPELARIQCGGTGSGFASRGGAWAGKSPILRLPSCSRGHLGLFDFQLVLF